MAKFTTGKELEDIIYNIIWKAEKTLLIVSPFIKLDMYFKELFDKHANNPKIDLIIVFGKNETDVNKSLSKDDLDYFKKFLNISIIYVPNLHAKYYANENEGVITSINLHDYSFKNNIEFGVYTELNILSNFTKTADQEAWKTCLEIANNNEVVFAKRPVYEKKLLSALLGKNYIKSDVLHDITDSFYKGWGNYKQGETFKKLNDFTDEIILGSVDKVRPTREEISNSKETSNSSTLSKHFGYCIRTGEAIPFNIEKPFSYEAYKKWDEYGNPDYPENYCHFSGEPSNGKTSFNKPVLSKNWEKANEFIGLPRNYIKGF